MDFTPRSDTPSQQGVPASNRAAQTNNATKRSNKKWSRLFGWTTIILLLSIAILVSLVIALFAFTDNKGQSKYVSKNDMQAVFLNGGQVYFGKITSLNDRYIAMSNIYYLRVNQQVQPNQTNTSANDVSLVKLGCELHGPQDQMIINSDQVVFWENLKSDGQVVQAVQEYIKQNPNGQNCNTEQSQSTNNQPAATDTTKKQ